MKEKSLIFVISQPRSGSTYLQSLLSNNKWVNTCNEPWVLLKFGNLLKPELFEADFDNTLATQAYRNFCLEGKGVNDKKLKDFLLELYSPLIKDYNFFLDKTPRYWEILEEILNLFPESQIIILKRNPLNVARSIMVTWEKSTMKELSYYSRDLLMAPKKLHDFTLKAQSNIYSITYENLVSNTKDEMEKLYDWLGIPFSENILNTKENQKFKGALGDPYLNSKEGYPKARPNVKYSNLTKEQNNFLEGYAHYLGEDFLFEYGGYKIESKYHRSNWTFKKFLHYSMRKSNIKLKKETELLFKDFIYRIF